MTTSIDARKKLRCGLPKVRLVAAKAACAVGLLLCVLAASTPVHAQLAQSVQYSYDSLNRLVEARYPDRLVRYAYDPAGNRVQLSVEVPNPVPAISQISPNKSVVGDPEFTLQVTGSLFAAGAVVQWNGSPRPTVFVSASVLTATISAADLTSAGIAQVTVVNPAPGGGTSNEIALTVSAVRTTPVITWETPAPISVGRALSVAQLNAVADVPGTFEYTPPAGTALSAGTHTLSVTFTPVDTVTYTAATKIVTIEVTKATPVVTWANPAGVASGTVLGAEQLNATANVAGTFTYTPPAGTVLTGGMGQVLSVTFTPTDTATYASATKTVTIDVTWLPPVLTGFAPGSGAIGIGVTLTGTGFTGMTGVTFHGVSAVYTVVSDTEVTTTVPAGTTTGPVRVTTPGGTATSAADFEVTNQRASRTLPPCYVPGYPVTVTLDAAPAPGVLVHALEELPPEGWARGAMSHDGAWDPSTSQMKWGPFFDATPRTITYGLTPPANATAAVTFAGVVSFDGVEVPVGGAKTLARCEQHPADANSDFRLVIGEVTGYGSAWKRGTGWETPPLPVPIGYVTRAGYLWRLGETYRRDVGDCPLCWLSLTPSPRPEPEVVPSPVGGPAAERDEGRPTLPRAARCTMTGIALRQAPTTYVPTVPLTVTLTVTPDGDVQTWALEETVPAGWQVNAVSADGYWDEKAGVVRWGPFFDETPQTLRYTLTPPTGVSGPQELRGTASFDGVDMVVTGVRTLQRAPITRPGEPGGPAATGVDYGRPK